MAYGGDQIELCEGAVLYEKTPGGVAVISLNEPDNMNAWSNRIAQGLFDGYDRATTDTEIKVIVVTGSGRAFCAGANMKRGDPLHSLERGISCGKDAELDVGICNDAKGRPFNYAYYIPKPIIAAINGACAGMGLSQALACDIRFSSDHAKFSTSFARRGLIAEGGISWTLPRVIGLGNAMDILLSGRAFDGNEAKQLGIVQNTFSGDQLMIEVMKYATEMATYCPVGSLAVIKQQLLSHQLTDQETALQESNRLLLNSIGPDSKEGISSFAQKRQPKFGPLDMISPLQKMKYDIFQQKLKFANLVTALKANIQAAMSKL